MGLLLLSWGKMRTTTGFLIDPWKSIMIGELRENDGVLGFRSNA
jgi:hypothetical protein